VNLGHFFPWKILCRGWYHIFQVEILLNFVKRKKHRKQGSLFCFVTSYSDLPNCGPSCCTLGIFGKLSMSRAAPTWLEPVWSHGMEAIDYWTSWKLNKIETENHIGIWGHSWCCQKALGESDLIEFISQFSELRCGRYWFWSAFRC
jgi:hypothetical protein